MSPGIWAIGSAVCLLLAEGGPSATGYLVVKSAGADGAAQQKVIPYTPREGDLVFYDDHSDVWLALFNLLPIPPLDGSAVVERLLPRAWWPGYLQLRQQALPVLVLIFVALSWSHWNPLGSAFAHVELWWLHVVT